MAVALADEYRAIRGEFEEQVLNRVFTELFLRVRPQFVFISLVCGASLDLIRLARIFGATVIVQMPAAAQIPVQDSRAYSWFVAALSSADALVCGLDQKNIAENWMPKQWLGDLLSPDQICAWIAGRHSDLAQKPHRTFNYGIYEFGMRDHALLREMQQGAVSFFRESQFVLDLACGAGIFLDLLTESGIKAEGVERNPDLVRYARDIGFCVHEADAFEYLKTLGEEPKKYDGIHCSHFIEHLPIAAVEELIQLLYAALADGGVLVLIFPDPESIRSQLLGFWRDPEHVRFYHPELVEIMARAVGFEPVYSNQRVKPRDVISFPMHMSSWPTTVPSGDVVQASIPARPRWWQRMLNLPAPKDESLLLANEELRRRIQVLEARSQMSEQVANTLWTVNQTWAWDDNATLCLRKPQR
ncbi:MAG: class I SAM-dependent methyltransferase [Halothiobacillus sp.]